MLSGFVRRLGDSRRTLQPTLAMYQRWYVQPSIAIRGAQRDVKAASSPATPTSPQNHEALSLKNKVNPMAERPQSEQSKPVIPITASPELKPEQSQEQQEAAQLASIRSRLRAAKVSKRPNEIEAIMREVRDQSVTLNAVELSTGFEGCMAAGNVEMATWILSYMKSQRYVVPAEYIGRVVKRASSNDHVAPLVALVKELSSTGAFKNTKQSIEEYLNCVLSAWMRNQRLKPEFIQQGLQQTYDIYHSLRNEKKMNVKLSRDTYTALAIFHINARQGDKCLEIFQEMNRVNVEPDLESCEKVLEQAIDKVETKVMKLIATWYLEVFNVPMDIKKAQEILKIAVKTSDGQLAILAFQLLTATSITPDRLDYYNLVRALLRSNDIVSAVEALQDMEARNVSFIPSYHETVANAPSKAPQQVSGISNAFDLHEKVKDELRDIFAKSVASGPELDNNSTSPSPSEAEARASREMLEDFYHVLVGQVQSGRPVPRIVVDTTLEAFGYCKRPGMSSAKHLKRLRSIFDEYPTAFKLQHDITSHVALINAASRHATFIEMLTLFQQLDHFVAHDQKPSVKDTLAYNQYDFIMKEGLSVAYSTLFTFMVDRSVMQGFKEIWHHMRKDAKVLPTTQCLLRLSKFASANRNKAVFDAVKSATNEALQRTLGGIDQKHPIHPSILKELAHGFDISQHRRLLQHASNEHGKKRTDKSPTRSMASNTKTTESGDKDHNKGKPTHSQKQQTQSRPRSAARPATPQAKAKSLPLQPQHQRL